MFQTTKLSINLVLVIHPHHPQAASVLAAAKNVLLNLSQLGVEILLLIVKDLGETRCVPLLQPVRWLGNSVCSSNWLPIE